MLTLVFFNLGYGFRQALRDPKFADALLAAACEDLKVDPGNSARRYVAFQEDIYARGPGVAIILEVTQSDQDHVVEKLLARLGLMVLSRLNQTEIVPEKAVTIQPRSVIVHGHLGDTLYTGSAPATAKVA